jgi:hypothetical protein
LVEELDDRFLGHGADAFLPVQGVGRDPGPHVGPDLLFDLVFIPAGRGFLVDALDPGRIDVDREELEPRRTDHDFGPFDHMLDV